MTGRGILKRLDQVFTLQKHAYGIFFTEEGKKQHSAMISEATAPKRRMDYIYRKRANWKAVAGVSGGFEDIEFFRKWCKRHKIGPGSCVYRRDKNKPYSPDNVIIIKKSA